MAVMWLVLGAKEARAVEHLRFEALFDLTFFHQPQKALFVGAPIALFFLICLLHRIGRRQQRLVHILNAHRRCIRHRLEELRLRLFASLFVVADDPDEALDVNAVPRLELSQFGGRFRRKVEQAVIDW